MRFSFVVFVALLLVVAAAATSSTRHRLTRSHLTRIRNRRYISFLKKQQEHRQQQHKQQHAETATPMSEDDRLFDLMLDGYYEAQADACRSRSRFCQHLGTHVSFLEMVSNAEDVYDSIPAAVRHIQSKLGTHDSSSSIFLDAFAASRAGVVAVQQVDVAVVGAGPAGLFASMQAWANGAHHVILLEKRPPPSYTLEQLVASAILPDDTNLDELHKQDRWYEWITSPLKSLNRKLGFFDDVSLKHVAIYLNAAASVLAGADGGGTRFAGNANQIQILLGEAFLAWCPPTLARDNYRLITLNNAPRAFTDGGPLRADQDNYCNLVQAVAPHHNNQWAIAAHGNALDTHHGYVFDNIKILSIADGARSRIRAAFFGGANGLGNVIEGFWPRNDVRPNQADNVHPRPHTVMWGAEAFLYDYTLMFVAEWTSGKYPLTNLLGELWREKKLTPTFANYWADNTLDQNKKISCGSPIHRQYVPSVIGAGLIDYVGHYLMDDIPEGEGPFANAVNGNKNYRNLFAGLTINVDHYDQRVADALGGIVLGVGGPALAGVQTLQALGLTSLFSRRGQGLCTYGMRLARTDGGIDWGRRWRVIYDIANPNAAGGPGRGTVNEFFIAVATLVGNAAFSDDLVYNNVGQTLRRSVFESLIGVSINRAVPGQNQAANANIAIVSLEGDAEFPAYFVTGKGVESAYKRSVNFGAMVRAFVVAANGGGLSAAIAAAATAKSDANYLYAHRQACKYLGQMAYYKTGHQLDISVARNMYAIPAHGGNCLGQAWACQCTAQGNFAADYYQTQNRAY